MFKRYERFILGFTALLLVAGLAYPLLPGGLEVEREAAGSPVRPAPYEPVVATSSVQERAVWPQPVEQSAGWLFDVFTPPKIYLDPDTGAFVPTGWKILGDEPFGLYLVSLGRKPYRFQLEGYIEEDRSDPAKRLLLLHDVATGRSLRLRSGDRVPAAGIEVVGFTVEKRRDEAGSITVVAEARLRDARLGREVRLKVNEVLYEDGVEAVFRSREDSGVRVVARREGERLKTPLGTYVVGDINLDAPGVTLIKEGDEQRQSVTRTLRPVEVGPESSGRPPEGRPYPPLEPGDESPPLFDF